MLTKEQTTTLQNCIHSAERNRNYVHTTNFFKRCMDIRNRDSKDEQLIALYAIAHFTLHKAFEPFVSAT